EPLWSRAGIIASVLAFWAGSVMSNAASRAALTINRKNHLMRNYQALELALRILIVLIFFQQVGRYSLIFIALLFAPAILMNVMLARIARKEWRIKSVGS